jgi:hypothetical protein
METRRKMEKTDAILPVTRIVAAAVIPFLWLAFLILFFFPDLTGERFAWRIVPSMTSLYMGAGYLGGSWLFVRTLLGRRWHRVHGGFPPVITFTWFMLIATLLHWDRFSHGRLGFQLWLVLYIVTPFLVPAIWLYNRRTDPGIPEEADPLVPSGAAWILRVAGGLLTAFAVGAFLYPPLIIRVWPWPLTPLTARVMCGWLALLGVGSLTLASDLRWSSWRVPSESIFVWHLLVLVAVLWKVADFSTGLLNWYTIALIFMVASLTVIYAFMENRRRKLIAQRSPLPPPV